MARIRRSTRIIDKIVAKDSTYEPKLVGIFQDDSEEVVPLVRIKVKKAVKQPTKRALKNKLKKISMKKKSP